MRAYSPAGLIGLLSITVLLAGCPSEPDPTGDTDTDSDTDTDTDTNSDTDTDTGPAGCDGDTKLRALEVPEAYAAYDACVEADPSDPQARFGRAITNTLRVTEWSEPKQLLTWCNESFTSDRAFGDQGLYRLLAEGDGGSYEVETSSAGSRSASGTRYDSFPVEPAVYAYRDGGQVWLDVTNPFGDGAYFYLELELDDVYQDGTRVALSDGLTIDMGRAGPQGRIFRYRAPCEAQYSSCDGWWDSRAAWSGTITIDQAGSRAGDELDITLDVVVPGYCPEADQNCAGEHRVTGTISDVLFDIPEDSDAPFYDIEDEDICKGDDCSDFWIMNVLAEVCDAPDLGAVHDQLGSIASSFRASAEDFEAAAKDPDFHFLVPHQANPLARVDAQINQADALALAAAYRGAVVALEAVEQYDLAGEDRTAESYVGTTSESYWNGRTCEPYDVYGMNTAETARMFNTEGLTHRSGADFTQMEEAFGQLLVDLRAVLAAAPSEQGVLEPTWSGNRKYLTEIDRDLASLQTSFDGGTRTKLATAPEYVLTLNEFFDAPPDRAQVLREAGVSDYFYGGGRCEDYLELDEDVAYWLAMGAGAADIPRAVIDGDIDSRPSFMDEDLFESTLDADDVPEWLDIRTLDALGFEY